MENFTPVPAALGGLLIGLSAAVLWLGLGRIAGISGLLGGILGPILDGNKAAWPNEAAWRAAFLAGLVFAPPLYAGLGGPVPEITVAASPVLLVVAGLLVGFGSRLGSGCTSGHGVCGIARLAPRSLLATAVFMAVAAVTVFVTRHLIGA
jgi:uncharacterized membrane protein YedE/YeeE